MNFIYIILIDSPRFSSISGLHLRLLTLPSRKELRSIRVGPRICHGQREGAVVLQVPMEFILELTSPNALATCSITLWVTRLDHEALNHPVEDDVVLRSRSLNGCNTAISEAGKMHNSHSSNAP